MTLPKELRLRLGISGGDEVVVHEEDERPLKEDSVAICSQIRTVSIEHRVTVNLGHLQEETMDEVESALEYSLGVRELYTETTSFRRPRPEARFRGGLSRP